MKREDKVATINLDREVSMPVSYDIVDHVVVLNSGVVTKVVTKDIMRH